MLISKPARASATPVAGTEHGDVPVEITQQLAEYAAGLRLESLPASLLEATKVAVLDTLGSAMAGTSAEGIQALRDLVREWRGAPQSSLWGFDGKVPAHHAALVNGAASRARDIDEVHEAAVMHSMATVLPVCLAVAEWKGGVPGRELIPAIVAGVDIMTRMGISLDNSPNVSGISSTWQLGTFGAAAAAGRLLGLDETGIVSALGSAACMAAGNQQPIIEGTMLVRVMQGITAQNGMTAAILASRNLNGPSLALEGRFGYFAANHQGKYDPAVITGELGERFEIANLSIKPFPCCKVIHSAVAGALEIKEKNNLRAEEIEGITVLVNQAAHNLVCRPLATKRRPSSIPGAQFSLPYCVAVALAKGDLFFDDFTPEALGDREVLDLAQKLEVVVDPEVERMCARNIGFSVVRVSTAGRGQFEARVERVKGSPQNPMNLDEVEKKFRKCAAFAEEMVSENALARVIEMVRHLERSPDVSALVEHL